MIRKIRFDFLSFFLDKVKLNCDFPCKAFQNEKKRWILKIDSFCLKYRIDPFFGHIFQQHTMKFVIFEKILNSNSTLGWILLNFLDHSGKQNFLKEKSFCHFENRSFIPFLVKDHSLQHGSIKRRGTFSVLLFCDLNPCG